LAVSGIPDPELRQQAKTALSVKGTEKIGEMMGADVESGEFMWGSIGLPGLDDMMQKSPYLAMTLFPIAGRGPVVGREGKLLTKATLGDTPHQYDIETNTIQLDKKYWKSLSSDEKLQLLRHEEGHAFFHTEWGEDGYTIIDDLAKNNKDAIRRMGHDLDYWDNLGVTDKLESAYQKAFGVAK
jgi:hypothetical protein